MTEKPVNQEKRSIWEKANYPKDPFSFNPDGSIKKKKKGA